MGSLAQKVDTIREQLGLVDGLSLAESVNVAVFQLGLADQVKGFNLVQKADACLTALLGTPSASAAAAPDVLIGLPVGAAQAPMEIGRTAEESSLGGCGSRHVPSHHGVAAGWVHANRVHLTEPRTCMEAADIGASDGSIIRPLCQPRGRRHARAPGQGRRGLSRREAPPAGAHR